MEVQSISPWQKRLKLLWSLWFMNLPHSAGRVFALIGNCIHSAGEKLLPFVIACFLFSTPKGFGPWLSLNLCCAQCIRMVLLCSFHESELCVQLGLQQSGAHVHGAGLARGVSVTACEGRAESGYWLLSRTDFTLKHLLYLNLACGRQN